MMKRTVALLSLLCASSPAVAQGNISHSGLYFGIGLGAGWAKYGGDLVGGSRVAGFSGNLRLGGHLKPNLLLAGETNVWYKGWDGITWSMSSIMGTGTLYPTRSAAFYVKGGLGYMFTSGEDDFINISSSHFAMQVGVGYDLKVSRTSALTLYANWIQGFSGTLVSSFSGNASVSPSIIQVGLGFSIY